MRWICVFCGSSPGARPAYAEAARALGRLMAERELGLVYGGASVGVMGHMARAVLEAGGNVIGVIPEDLLRKEVAFTELPDLRVVDSMHARKLTMMELSDAFIALPGGFGTFEELFEALTWGQLGLHAKPCGLLNVCGYYDGLLHFLDHVVTQAFVAAPHRAMLLVEDEPAALLDRFAAYRPPQVDKARLARAASGEG